MKKAVAHLIPFMEKEKEEMYAKMIAEGKKIKDEVCACAEVLYYHNVIGSLSWHNCFSNCKRRCARYW